MKVYEEILFIPRKVLCSEDDWIFLNYICWFIIREDEEQKVSNDRALQLIEITANTTYYNTPKILDRVLEVFGRIYERLGYIKNATWLFREEAYRDSISNLKFTNVVIKDITKKLDDEAVNITIEYDNVEI